MKQVNKMIQLSFDLTGQSDEADQLIAILSEVGFDSFWQEENEVHAYIAQEKLNTAEITKLLQEQFQNKIPAFRESELEDINWNKEWEKNYDPTVVANQIFIYAPFHVKDESYPYSILIEPKMSFGTAHHGTTASMLTFLLETDIKEKSVIDAGCGTGILAIFASMLGAREVFPYDNDPWSVENANENFTRNGISGVQVQLGESEILKGKTCDIFLANIHKNVIIKEIPEYAKTLSANGLLFLSGFYLDDLDDIKTVCKENGLLFEKYLEKDQWIAAKFTKKDFQI